MVRYALLSNSSLDYIDLSSCTATACDCSGATGFFAHFYVLRDGRIFQVLETEGADSVAPQVYGMGINSFAVGIEIVHAGGDGQRSTVECGRSRTDGRAS
jgi:N-acetyl-anhydromuramyl-L-alanine amidase AmpD